MSKKEETKKTAETSAAEESSKAAAPKATRGTGKKIKYGSMSMGIVIVVIAIVVLLNLMCGLVVKRYPVKLDLTSDNRYDLSDESIDALKSLEKDVDIVVTCPESDFEGLSNQYKAINNARQEAIYQNQQSTSNKNSIASKSQDTKTYNEQVLGLKYNEDGSIKNPYQAEQKPAEAAPAENVITCEDGLAPDANGCCTGEIYTDMGEQGFNCCPQSGGDCFPPIL